MSDIDKSKIKNMGVKGCIICQNPRLSKIIDPILFEAETDIKGLKDQLEDEYFIFLDIKQLSAHMKHIFYEEDDSTEEIEKLVNKLKQTKNKDAIAEAIAHVQYKKHKMVKTGRDESKGFYNLQRLESELLSLKAKVDGDLVEKVEVTMPEWVKKRMDG